ARQRRVRRRGHGGSALPVAFWPGFRRVPGRGWRGHRARGRSPDHVRRPGWFAGHRARDGRDARQLAVDRLRFAKAGARDFGGRERQTTLHGHHHVRAGTPVNPPRVRVVVPTFNRLALLRVAVASVQAQTEADLEIIVVDDRSTDGTPEWLEQLARQDRRVTVVRNERSLGGAGARNAGIERAQAPWIAFLDD